MAFTNLPIRHQFDIINNCSTVRRVRVSADKILPVKLEFAYIGKRGKGAWYRCNSVENKRVYGHRYIQWGK